MLVRALLLFALALVAPRPAAQGEPFETFSLTASGQADLGSGLDPSGYHESWTPGPGLSLRASSPFYFGTAHAGLQMAWHDGAGPLPGYLAMLVYGGLGARLDLPLGLEAEPAVLSGILSMDFLQDEVIGAAGRRESELVVGASLDVSAPLTRSLRAVLGGQVVQVYTSPRFRLASATLGLRWTVGMPGWLRRVLDS